MEDFFRGIMIQGNGIYTLCGSKPVNEITIDYYTDEEIEMLNKDIPEDDRKHFYFRKNYDLAHKWEKWEKIRERFPMNRYLLFKKEHPIHPKYAFIWFVDIFKLAITLQEHYTLFQRETEMDFDPLRVALEIEKGSEFWDAVFEKAIDSSALVGILFGYGVKNSFCFQWKWWSDPDLGKFANLLQSKFSDHPQKGEAIIDRLSIPAFASFFEDDEIIEKYNKERERIKKIYQGHDFLNLTLSKLTGS